MIVLRIEIHKNNKIKMMRFSILFDKRILCRASSAERNLVICKKHTNNRETLIISIIYIKFYYFIAAADAANAAYR